MVLLPYGISNFKRLVRDNRFYQDRTQYLEKLEAWHSPYLFYLRPRRFGKSLFISVLEYYYGKIHQSDFNDIFGKYYIGKNPSHLANQFMVLKFDFSGIDTENKEIVFRRFTATVQSGVIVLMSNYPKVFSKKSIQQVEGATSAAEVIEFMLQAMKSTQSTEKIYLVIDEYDHFTNELIAFNLDNFREIVSQNGFVRKFFEMIKKGTQDGIIEKIFATGVSPITLDSLTSGFNIGDNISLQEEFHDMMGFTEPEVEGLLKKVGVQTEKIETTIADIRKWYNGYLFQETAKNRVYNPDMALYFAKEFSVRGEYPKNMLDINISSDYGKINRMFKINSEAENYQLIETLLEEKSVDATLTLQFSFERPWTQDDFLSLLFYMGLVTIDKGNLGSLKFRIPNYVIEELFYRYFFDKLLRRSELYHAKSETMSAIVSLAQDNNIQPLLKEIESILTTLSNRDAMRFSEKHLKVILASLFHVANIYFIKSEPEEHRKYIDLLLLRRPPIDPNFQFAFELKYLKKENAHLLEKTKAEAIEQLKGYLKKEPYASMTDLKAHVLVFVGTDSVVAEELPL